MKLSQKQDVQSKNMQNETWLDSLEDYKFRFFSQNEFDQQTKDTSPRKIPAQARKYWSRMNTLRKKEAVKQKSLDKQESTG